MVRFTSTPAGLATEKLATLRERMLPIPTISHTQSDTATRITMHSAAPAPDGLDADFYYRLQSVRDNFKKYNTKAKWKISSYVFAPNAEQKRINDCFNKDAELKRLTKYLNISLNEFAQNLKRFMRSIKDTDYKLIITPANPNSPNLNIVIKNSKGRQIGPFLTTSLCQDNSDGYSRLNVSIGYIGKAREKVPTHFFSYNADRNIDEYVEQRGDRQALRTERQINHDHFSKFSNKKMLTDLRYKYKYDAHTN